MGGYVTAIVIAFNQIFACLPTTCTGTYKSVVEKGFTSTCTDEQKGSIDASISFGIASNLFTDVGVKSSASASFTSTIQNVSTNKETITIDQPYTGTAYFYQTNMTYKFSDGNSVNATGGYFMSGVPLATVEKKIPMLAYHVDGLMAQEGYLQYMTHVDFPENLRNDLFWKQTAETQNSMVDGWIVGQMEKNPSYQVATWTKAWYTCIWDIFHGCNTVWFYNNAPNTIAKAGLIPDNNYQIMFVGSNKFTDLIPRASRTYDIGNFRRMRRRRMELKKLAAPAQALAPNIKGFIQSKDLEKESKMGTTPMPKVLGHSPPKLRRRMTTLH